MTDSQMEGRIAELEHALEDLLECFEPLADRTCVEVYVTTSDGLQLMPMEISDDVDVAVEAAHEILYGGVAYAEED